MAERRKMDGVLLLFVVLVPSSVAALNTYTYSVDDTPGLGRRFDGVGGLSGGGATSKLLVNYPEKERNDILDYLFKPNFGASLHILKVEIGGDGQSTEGTEASHMHYPWDLNFHRGYEWWMMKEAKKRNPDIKIYGLPWTFPGWVGKGTQSPYTDPQLTATYVCNWIEGAKLVHNITVDYIGIWNESAYNATYIIVLRKTLDLRGFHHVQIVAADGGWQISADILSNPDLAKAVSIIGAHQPHTDSGIQQLETGKPLWASEDFSQKPDKYGGACWARTINQDYSNGFITAQISWCVIDSMYDGLPYSDNGLMRAVQPWSGFYYVAEPIWASAHTTQFTKPGWTYLKHGAGVGNFSYGGSYVTFISPDNKDVTIVIETGTFNHSHCRKYIEPFTVQPQNVVLQLKGTLANITSLNVWYTKFRFDGSNSTIFEQRSPIQVSNGQISLSLDIDEVWTLTTISTGHKGLHELPPPPSDFPLPYTDDFEAYPIFSEAYNLVQQAGVYEITEVGQPHGQVTRQMSLQSPVSWHTQNLPGVTVNLIGDMNWTDISISVDARPAPINGTDGVFVATRLVGRGLDLDGRGGFFFTVFIKTKIFIVSTDIERKRQVVNGTVPNLGSEWNRFSLSVKGQTAVGMVNNNTVFKSIVPKQVVRGFAGFGTTSYRLADFDNLYIDHS